MARVKAKQLVGDIDSRRVLDRVDLTIEDGEFVGLIGPSGAGKTSILRAIAGFDAPTSGRILFDGLSVPSIDLGLVGHANRDFFGPATLK